jgi:hypothetical protein
MLILSVVGISLLWAPNIHAQVRVSVPPGGELIQPHRERVELGRAPVRLQDDTLEGAQEYAAGEYDGEALSDWARAYLNRTRATATTERRTLQDRIEGVRAMYFLSVEEGDWVDIAKDSLSLLMGIANPETPEEATIQGYRGAIEVVRAKHSRWPPNKLKYLNQGAAILDFLVEAYPNDLELRYLRLASYRFLPFFLSREESVAEDLQILVEDLPRKPEVFSPTIYRAVLSFVLESGELEEVDRIRFEQAMGVRPMANGDTKNGR